jgi:DNA-binding YbaB/EbfC family protein
MMKGQIAGLMKQAQQMQENVKKAQEKLTASEVVGEAGGGLVKVTMMGDHTVKAIDIDPSLLSDEKEMIEGVITAACIDAKRKVDELSTQIMGGVAGGMGMPPGFKLPF